MNIGGVEYKRFTELEEGYEIKKATILRLVKKYGIPYKVFGRVKLISDENLLKLLEKNTKDYEERRKKQRDLDAFDQWHLDFLMNEAGIPNPRKQKRRRWN